MILISQNLVIGANAQSALLNNARIAHDSFTLRAGVNVTASSQAAGFSAACILNPLTYERWQPITLPATLLIDLGGDAQYADYIGIAAHNLGTMRARVTIEYSTDNLSFTTLQEISPGDNTPIMVLFDATLARYWRLTVSDADAAPYIGVFYVGQALVMQRQIYAGVTPPKFNFDTKVITNRSDTGQTLGRTVVRSGIPQTFKWQHLERPWVDLNIPQFLANARERAFFVAWRPKSHPEDVIFGELESDPVLTNMGTLNYMDMSIQMRGTVNE